MKPGMTTVATFGDREKAQAVQNRLEQAGIHAEAADESFFQRFWYLSKPLADEKVYVAEGDYDKARQFLQAADKQDHILQGELRCPKCGSVRIDYPQFTRKFIATTFAEAACFLHLMDKQFFCKACNHTWPAKVTLRPKEDVLGYPKEGPRVKDEKG